VDVHGKIFEPVLQFAAVVIADITVPILFQSKQKTHPAIDIPMVYGCRKPRIVRFISCGISFPDTMINFIVIVIYHGNHGRFHGIFYAGCRDDKAHVF